MRHATTDDHLPRLLGGMACLDFVNTVDPRHAANQTDFLTDYDVLARWAGHAGAVPPGTARDLALAGASHPEQARDVLGAARELREHLYQVIRPLLDGEASPGPSVDVLSAAVSRAHAARRLVPVEARALTWDWHDRERLDLPLLAVALSAADLVTSKAINRVRECPGADGCGWLFLDTSKSGTRRWCSMQVCGNRVKVQRHRAR
jgi:predicted RNA-binding Zn ribbon-like protein